ncbi:MAG: sigma-70 family RNA polymerase sigma factor [Planctomycetia bacterium]|nr:sigma-70 family RNA polymerase sigma factor [Planctomycetia bacterium]
MQPIGKTSQMYAAQDPDIRLMLRVRNDDNAAFQELVTKYQHRLIGILTHLCGSADEAEDLAQEVFLRVYRARNDYSPQAKFSTWLFTIANNVALNALRRRKRKPSYQIDPLVSQSGSQMARPEEALVPAVSTEPDRRMRHQELANVVELALSQLNERQRLAVVLNKFEEMSYEEIAQVIGISAKAVKSLLSRARTQLRDILRTYVETELMDDSQVAPIMLEPQP